MPPSTIIVIGHMMPLNNPPNSIRKRVIVDMRGILNDPEELGQDIMTLIIYVGRLTRTMCMDIQQMAVTLTNTSIAIVTNMKTNNNKQPSSPCPLQRMSRFLLFRLRSKSFTMLLVHQQPTYTISTPPTRKWQHAVLANHIVGAKPAKPTTLTLTLARTHSHSHSLSSSAHVHMCSAAFAYVFCAYNFNHPLSGQAASS